MPELFEADDRTVLDERPAISAVSRAASRTLACVAGAFMAFFSCLTIWCVFEMGQMRPAWPFVILFNMIVDVLLVLLFVSVLLLVWGLAQPQWVERILAGVFNKFLLLTMTFLIAAPLVQLIAMWL